MYGVDEPNGSGSQLSDLRSDWRLVNFLWKESRFFCILQEGVECEVKTGLIFSSMSSIGTSYTIPTQTFIHTGRGTGVADP